MTLWTNAAQYAIDALAILLIVRLLSLKVRREGVYLVFALFLAFQIFTSLEFFAVKWLQLNVDYRLLWLVSTLVMWVFSLALVYSLSKVVLAELPGIQRLSRKLLNIVFVVAIGLAASTVSGEYTATGGAKLLDRIDRVLVAAYTIDRAIAMSASLVLVVILAFILWFPVKMPRNLAIFSVGFVIYFTAKTAFSLFRTYSAPGAYSHTIGQWVSVAINLVLVACFIYWVVFIDPKGQTAQVRIGHSWHVADQNRLIDQLEALNSALLRSSRDFENADRK